MTKERKDEIERLVFYRHVDSIMRILEKCEDTFTVFQMGLEMGYIHKDLSEQLEMELVEGK